MSNQPTSRPDVDAYQLMRAGRVTEALIYAERAVADQLVCVPTHGMLRNDPLAARPPSRHWRAVLGEALHEVEYERLVENPNHVGSRAAERCALEWKPEAIEVQRSAAVSLTASAAQIRRPIYGSSSGRWRHYRKHLGALVTALRDLSVELPHDG